MAFKQSIALFFTLFVITLLGASPALGQQDKPTLNLVYSETEFYPYQMGNGEQLASPPGISIDLITQAAMELGIKVKFTRRPNRRVYEELRRGLFDGAFVFSFKESRLELGQYPMNEGKLDGSRRIVSVSYYIYKKMNSTLDWDGENFKNLKGAVAANDGYSIVGDLRGKGIEVEEMKTTEENLSKLQHGRVAGYAAQAIATDHHVDSGRYGNIVKVPTPLATKGYFLMFSNQFMKKHPQVAEQLWTKIAQLRDELTNELMPKYKSLKMNQ